MSFTTISVTPLVNTGVVLTAPAVPQKVYDRENRQYTKEQATDASGVPLWRAEVGIPNGYLVAPLRVKIASEVRPPFEAGTTVVFEDITVSAYQGSLYVRAGKMIALDESVTSQQDTLDLILGDEAEGEAA